MNSTRTVIIPAVGLGTRMRPASQLIPKELLPVGGRPALDWILEEAAGVGFSRIIVVSSPQKPAIAGYIDRICSGGNLAKHPAWPTRVLGFPDKDVELIVVYQPEPRGLGDAVLTAAKTVDDESFAVMLPDEIMLNGSGLLSIMLEHHKYQGHCVLSVLEVPPAEITNYGCVEVSGFNPGGTHRVIGCIEKPESRTAPSSFAITGRYVLSRELIEDLERTGSDNGGEIQLTSALHQAAQRDSLIGLDVVPEDGRIDVGNWAGWLEANCQAFARDGTTQTHSVPSLTFAAGLAV